MSRPVSCCLWALIGPISTWWRASTRFERGSAPPILPPRNWLTSRGRRGGRSSPAKMCPLSTRSMATAYFVLARGAGGAEAAVAAALVGVVVAGAGFLLVARIFRRDEALGLDKLMATRGLILWVRVRSPEQQALAQEILRAHRAQAIRVHEIEIEKRPEDLPLGTVRPDPWLGSEPLGHP